MHVHVRKLCVGILLGLCSIRIMVISQFVVGTSCALCMLKLIVIVSLFVSGGVQTYRRFPCVLVTCDFREIIYKVRW